MRMLCLVHSDTFAVFISQTVEVAYSHIQRILLAFDCACYPAQIFTLKGQYIVLLEQLTRNKYSA